MSFVIILRGPAGSGKTTMAMRLNNLFDTHYISVDKVKSEKGLKHSEAEKLEANKTIIAEAEDHLEQGEVVIIDEVFYYERQLKELIEKLNYPYKIFSLKAPLDECLKRHDARRKAGLRKMPDSDVKLVHKLVGELEKGIVIDTSNQNEDEALNEMLSYLPPLKRRTIHL
ncbi:MAG: AAA family ATPase [Nanobdellota archaeon]